MQYCLGGPPELGDAKPYRPIKPTSRKREIIIIEISTKMFNFIIISKIFFEKLAVVQLSDIH